MGKYFTQAEINALRKQSIAAAVRDLDFGDTSRLSDNDFVVISDVSKNLRLKYSDLKKLIFGTKFGSQQVLDLDKSGTVYTHNMGKYPEVTVLLYDGEELEEVETYVKHLDEMRVQIEYSIPYDVVGFVCLS